MSSSRRNLLLGACGVLFSGISGRLVAADPEMSSSNQTKTEANKGNHSQVHDMSVWPENWTNSEQIAMLVYPGFTMLDLIGPQYLFAGLMGAKIQIVSATKDPITSDTHVTILPTATYDEVPNELSVLFIPGGGESVIKALGDKALMSFVRSRGEKARFVTSACTGSLILAGAGLLSGYKATSHWIARDALVAGGAIPVNERVVQDRNRITGAGVTAGIDLGLTVVAKLRDDAYAQSLQLLAEYAPKPPFNAGTPETAPKEVTDMMRAMFTNYSGVAQEKIKDALSRTA